MSKYSLYLFIPALFLSSCMVSKAYNTPFINAEETTYLEFGMSKDQARELLNDPLYVESGDGNSVVWVYEVRTLEVEPRKNTNGTVTPRKNHDNTQHAGPIHKLSLTFNSNGRLESWESEYAPN